MSTMYRVSTFLKDYMSASVSVLHSWFLLWLAFVDFLVVITKFRWWYLYIACFWMRNYNRNLLWYIYFFNLFFICDFLWSCFLDAGLREKLNKIMASDYFTTTPEMKGPVEVAAAAGNYTSFQVPVHGSVVPVQVEGLAAAYEQEVMFDNLQYLHIS